MAMIDDYCPFSNLPADVLTGSCWYCGSDSCPKASPSAPIVSTAGQAQMGAIVIAAWTGVNEWASASAQRTSQKLS